MTMVQMIGCGGGAFIITFLLGVLTGNGLLTRQQNQRARRQARTQRLINGYSERTRDQETMR